MAKATFQKETLKHITKKSFLRSQEVFYFLDINIEVFRRRVMGTPFRILRLAGR